MSLLSCLQDTQGMFKYIYDEYYMSLLSWLQDAQGMFKINLMMYTVCRC